MRLICGLVLCIAMAVPAAAKPALRDVSEIDNGLMAVAIADEIRKQCDGINARMIRAFSTINALKTKATALGYSDDEIEAYVTSKKEKARMRDKAQRYLDTKGVAANKRAALCAFGRAEMAKNSAIGRLLR